MRIFVSFKRIAVHCCLSSLPHCTDTSNAFKDSCVTLVRTRTRID